MKKGFTIVELLASIAIMVLIIIISVPAYEGISKTIKEQNLNSKISMIEQATKSYVNKYKKDKVYDNGVKTICFTMDYLINKNIVSPDNKTEDGLTDPLNGGNLEGYIVASYDITNYEVVVNYKTEASECNASNTDI